MASDRAPQPGVRLLGQWNLMRAATQDDRFSRGDLAVLMSIIQRYVKSKGNGWADIDLLVEMSSMSRRQTIRAIANLKEAEYVFVLAPGRRGSATVYLPNFALGDRFSATHGTESDLDELGAMCGTESADLGAMCGTESADLGATHGTPSYLRNRPTSAGLRESRNDVSAAASPPPVPDAHGTGPAGPAEGGFEELYRAYGVRRNKAAAQAAYGKLDPGLHDQIVEAARAWRQAAPAGMTRKTLEVWLREQRYDEDPPQRYEKPARKKRQAANDDKPAPKPAEPKPATRRRTGSGEIVSSRMDTAEGEKTLTITLSDGSNVSMKIQSADANAQGVGQQSLEALCAALGAGEVENSCELHGALVAFREGSDGGIEWTADVDQPTWPRDSEAAANHRRWRNGLAA